MNDREHLQLMVYDSTDVAKRLRELQRLDVLPGDWELPDITLPVGLSHSWFVGGRLYRRLGAIDTFAGFDNWEEALNWIATVHPRQKIDHLQYWGHGSPGRVWMADEKLDHRAFSGPHAEVLAQISDRLTDDALVWFRTCATFGAERGRLFARQWSQDLGCRVAAHTHNIGVFHAGLHSLRPGQDVHWPVGEGVKSGTATSPGEMEMTNWLGGWGQPNVVSCLTNEFPGEW